MFDEDNYRSNKKSLKNMSVGEITNKAKALLARLLEIEGKMARAGTNELAEDCVNARYSLCAPVKILSEKNSCDYEQTMESLGCENSELVSGTIFMINEFEGMLAQEAYGEITNCVKHLEETKGEPYHMWEKAHRKLERIINEYEESGLDGKDIEQIVDQIKEQVKAQSQQSLRNPEDETTSAKSLEGLTTEPEKAKGAEKRQGS